MKTEETECKSRSEFLQPRDDAARFFPIASLRSLVENVPMVTHKDEIPLVVKGHHAAAPEFRIRTEERREHVRDAMAHRRGEVVQDNLRRVICRTTVVRDVLGELEIRQLIVCHGPVREIHVQESIDLLRVFVDDNERREATI